MPNPAVETGILIFAHGSRVEEANRGVRELAQRVQDCGGFSYVRAAFLEMALPDLKAAVAEAVQAGCARLIVIPYFLTPGVHLRRDLPELVAREREQHPEMDIQVGESLEKHPLMPSLVLDRIQAILKTCSTPP